MIAVMCGFVGHTPVESVESILTSFEGWGIHSPGLKTWRAWLRDEGMAFEMRLRSIGSSASDVLLVFPEDSDGVQFLLRFPDAPVTTLQPAPERATIGSYDPTRSQCTPGANTPHCKPLTTTSTRCCGTGNYRRV